jgi:hypothetical protein
MHSPRASRRLAGSALATAVVLGLAMLSGCSDSPVDPLAVSPVGRYELVGCTYGADTVAAHMEPTCGSGGSNNYHWDSGYVLLNADRTVTRNLVVTNTAYGNTVLYSKTDTSVVVGHWTQNGRELTAAWTGLPYAATSTFTRVNRALIRANDIWNDSILFWFRRTS